MIYFILAKDTRQVATELNYLYFQVLDLAQPTHLAHRLEALGVVEALSGAPQGHLGVPQGRSAQIHLELEGAHHLGQTQVSGEGLARTLALVGEH